MAAVAAANPHLSVVCGLGTLLRGEGIQGSLSEDPYSPGPGAAGESMNSRTKSIQDLLVWMDQQKSFVPVQKMIAHVREQRVTLRTVTIQDYIRQLDIAGFIKVDKAGWFISESGQKWLIDNGLRETVRNVYPCGER